MPPSGSRSAPPATWCRMCRSRGSDRRRSSPVRSTKRCSTVGSTSRSIPSRTCPPMLPEGIVVAAVSEREDPSDALVGRGPIRWSEVPQHATVATSSLRRKAQLLHARPDLRVSDSAVTWTPDSGKLDSAEGWSAILLAAAGLAPARPGPPDRRAAATGGDAAGTGTGSAGGHGAGGRPACDRCGSGRGAPPAERTRRQRRAGVSSAHGGRLPGAGGRPRGTR